MVEASIDALFHALALPECELSVVFTDDDHIRELNREWRGEDTATDVLSFPGFEPHEIPELAQMAANFGEPPALGDVVISLEYAQRLVESGTHTQRVATELGVDPADLTWSLAHEVAFLLIHSLLHLVGLDHDGDEDEAVMKAEEVRLWETIAGRVPASTT